jgi:hypothetical protein
MQSSHKLPGTSSSSSTATGQLEAGKTSDSDKPAVVTARPQRPMSAVETIRQRRKDKSGGDFVTGALQSSDSREQLRHAFEDSERLVVEEVVVDDDYSAPYRDPAVVHSAQQKAPATGSGPSSGVSLQHMQEQGQCTCFVLVVDFCMLMIMMILLSATAFLLLLLLLLLSLLLLLFFHCSS